MPCLVPRPGGAAGMAGAVGLLHAQLGRKISGCAPATCSLPVFASAEGFLVPLGQARCVHTHAHMRVRMHVSVHTHLSLSPPRHATPSPPGRAGGAGALKLLFCSCREFGSWCQAFECDSQQRKGGGGDGSASEASTRRGRAQELGPCMAVAAAAIEVAKAASATANASDPDER